MGYPFGKLISFDDINSSEDTTFLAGNRKAVMGSSSGGESCTLTKYEFVEGCILGDAIEETMTRLRNAAHLGAKCRIWRQFFAQTFGLRNLMTYFHDGQACSKSKFSCAINLFSKL